MAFLYLFVPLMGKEVFLSVKVQIKGKEVLEECENE